MSTHLPINWVGRGNHTAPGIQASMDTSLRNGHSLLFHDFVNGDPINIRHLVKFIDADHSSISKNHGASFESSLSCFFVCGNRRCETHA